MSEGEWQPDDPFVDPNDPDALERERRRREREERRSRRQEKERKQAEKERQRTEADRPSYREVAPRQASPEEARRPRLPRLPQAGFADRIGEMRKRLAGMRIGQRNAPPTGYRRVEAQDRPGGGDLLARLSGNRVRLALLLAGVLLLLFLVALFQPFHGEGSGKVLVQVPKGASVGEVGDVLDERGVVTSSTLFQMRVTLAGKRSELYPGNFTLAEGMSYGDAIDALSTPPRKRTITVLVPEGLSRAQVAPTAKAAGVSGSYTAASRRSEHIELARYGAAGARDLEGFLFPATYELRAGGSAEDLVQLQLQAFQDRIREVDMRYARSKNLTVYDVLIIASMIEREVQVPRERKLVAAVIYNRLRRGEPLGIDATTRFAVGNYDKPLTSSQLATDSPYNTRINAGLPPGPIGSPGIAAIDAAAHPAKVNYLFYVVKPGTCGEHSFSFSETDFLRDQAAYQKALEAAGGSPTEC